MMEKQVAFKSGGEKIFGILHLPEQLPAPGVVMCHGFTGTKVEPHRIFVDNARELARNGMAVLRFDFRGSGDSAGEFRDMTVGREIADAQAAVDFMCRRKEVDASRIGLMGLSMGGCVSACVAGRDARIKALVLWSAVGNMERVFEWMIEPFGKKKQIADFDGLELRRGFFEELPRIKPLEEVKCYPGPALVIHGANDTIVPVSDAYDYAAVLGKQGKLKLIKDADHVFASIPWKKKVITATRDFMVEQLF